MNVVLTFTISSAPSIASYRASFRHCPEVYIFDTVESNMEDMYVKPGNQERGWNDPPQFSYGLQMARGPQKNPLNKRVAPPDAGVPPMTPPPPLANPLAPPPCGLTPPPTGGPPCRMAMPPSGPSPMRSQKESDSSQSESEPDVEDVVSVLEQALAACRQSVADQVCNDMAKRLRLLRDSWRSGRLSLPVKKRMKTLTSELKSCNWDSADEIHRSLMVDHVTEVSQWMVGVKRLIAETRKLKPEALESLKKMTRDEPVHDASEPAKALTEPEQDAVSQS